MGLDPGGTPTLQSGDGAVRVLGAAATSGPRLTREDIAELRRRQAAEISQLAADSPTADTVEFGGRTISEANRSLALRDVSDAARTQLSALSWAEFSRLRGMSPAELDRIGRLPPAELRDFIDSLAPPTSDAGPDRGGTASNMGDFRGDARRGPELTHDQMAGMVGDQLRLVRPDGAHYDVATNTFTLANGQRVRVEVGSPRDNSVASFEPDGNDFVVTVSSRARDQDVVRAVAHELAEIDAARRDDIELDNSNDRPDQLTTHLLGRYAEVRVLIEDMLSARHATDPASATRATEGDLRQLLDGLGMTGPDAEARIRMLGEHDPELLGRLMLVAPGMLPGADTSPPRPSYRPDRLDHQVSRLTPDQQAYYDDVIARSPNPNDPKVRKKAYKDAKRSRRLSDDDISTVVAAQERLASMRVRPIDDASNPNPNLVQLEISFDGTWNSRDDMIFDTNPALLEEMFSGPSDYQVGVGTTPATMLLGGLSGAGISNRINRAYENLVAEINRQKQANPDAEIVVITAGFSRGSTAARAFVNELNERGVPDLLSRDRLGRPTRYHEPPRIGAMILFDTVGSVGIPGTNLNPGLDLRIPANAENVLHLTAGDEVRGPFPLSSAVDPDVADDRIAEIELPGAHSDVGGSYANEYSRIALQMAQGYLRRLGARVPEVDPTTAIDPTDPALRLHHSGGNPSNRRGVYPSYNPEPSPEVQSRAVSDEDGDE
jgi:hypothetical protein